MTRVLIIEDEDPIREDIMEILELEGFEVLGANNGRTGVDLARQYLPDLIVCDIMMPQLDGFGVLFELRSDRLTSTIPFLFLTARTERADMRYGMSLGADDYVTKPFTIDELTGAIHTRLSKRNQLVERYEDQIQILRGAISSSLPHELRTPLTAIMGYTSFILEDVESVTPAQLEQMMMSIFHAGKRLTRLIENYLTYVQFEFAELKTETVRQLRQHAIENPIAPAEMLQTTIKEKAIEFNRQTDLVLELEDCSIQIVERDLLKIVEELVDNAFRFSKDGSSVQVFAGSRDGSFVLEVRDQGRGMTPEQIENLGAYVQYDRKIYEQQGIGLGLTVVRGLTSLHGGVVDITSSPAEGTHVIVKFPWIS